MQLQYSYGNYKKAQFIFGTTGLSCAVTWYKLTSDKHKESGLQQWIKLQNPGANPGPNFIFFCQNYFYYLN